MAWWLQKDTAATFRFNGKDPSDSVVESHLQAVVRKGFGRNKPNHNPTARFWKALDSDWTFPTPAIVPCHVKGEVRGASMTTGCKIDLFPGVGFGELNAIYRHEKTQRVHQQTPGSRPGRESPMSNSGLSLMGERIAQAQSAVCSPARNGRQPRWNATRHLWRHRH